VVLCTNSTASRAGASVCLSAHTQLTQKAVLSRSDEFELWSRFGALFTEARRSGVVERIESREECCRPIRLFRNPSATLYAQQINDRGGTVLQTFSNAGISPAVSWSRALKHTRDRRAAHSLQFTERGWLQTDLIDTGTRLGTAAMKKSKLGASSKQKNVRIFDSGADTESDQADAFRLEEELMRATVYR
jgi:hypothetical protein